MRHAKCLPTMVCLLAGLAQAQDAASGVWDRAMKALEEKRFQAVRDLCGEFEQLKPGTREAPYVLAVARWAEAYPDIQRAAQDGKLTPSLRETLRQKWSAALADGHRQVQRALAADPFYADAMAYDNLLYRLEAQIAASASEAATWTARADARVKEAIETMKSHPQKRTLGLSIPPPPPPPPPPPRKVVDE